MEIDMNVLNKKSQWRVIPLTALFFTGEKKKSCVHEALKFEED